jgi:hypothetical protein
MKEIKFGTKIKFLIIQVTDDLITKKQNKGLKGTFQLKFKATTYINHFFHFSYLSFNSVVP